MGAGIGGAISGALGDGAEGNRSAVGALLNIIPIPGDRISSRKYYWWCS